VGDTAPLALLYVRVTSLLRERPSSQEEDMNMAKQH